MSLLGLSRSTSVDVQKFLAYEPTSLMKPEPGLVKQNAANIYNLIFAQTERVSNI